MHLETSPKSDEPFSVQSRYMLGDNGDNSYVVGFSKSYPRYVQSMGASCPGTPTHPIVRLIPAFRWCLQCVMHCFP